MKEVFCDYCGWKASLVGGDKIYPHRPDLAGGKYYLCRRCMAWVGCHPGTDTPLGRLADKRLRDLKHRGHELFDPIWKKAKELRGGGNAKNRNAAYKWLADGMGIPQSECHFGMFSPERAEAAILFLEAFYRRISANR